MLGPMRIVRVVAAGLMLAALFAGAGGCQTVGPSNRFDRNQAALDNPSPVTLDLQNNDQRVTASGVGSAQFTTVTNDTVQTQQTGVTPRSVFVRLMPDGTRQVNVNSGTDIQAKGIRVNPQTGEVSIDEVGTIASAPTKAQNEAYDRLVAYFQSLSNDQLEALKAEQATVQAVAPTAANVIDAIIKAMTSGAVP